MKLSLKRSNPLGVKIATQGSSHLARTSPSENEARNFAGIVRRFFASSEYSKWPLNAMKFSVGVAEWEEPRDSDLFACHEYCPTLPHFATSFPTRPIGL